MTGRKTHSLGSLVNECAHVYVCVCVCVWMRDRESGRVGARTNLCVCECACLCERVDGWEFTKMRKLSNCYKLWFRSSSLTQWFKNRKLKKIRKIKKSNKGGWIFFLIFQQNFGLFKRINKSPSLFYWQLPTIVLKIKSVCYKIILLHFQWWVQFFMYLDENPWPLTSNYFISILASTTTR